jgi:hypothetical protein
VGWYRAANVADLGRLGHFFDNLVTFACTYLLNGFFWDVVNRQI